MQEVDCGLCGGHVVTDARSRMGWVAWLALLPILILGYFFILPLSPAPPLLPPVHPPMQSRLLLPLPFCWAGLQDVEHECPNCRRRLGWAKRHGPCLALCKACPA